MITHPMKYLYSFFADALPALSWCVVGDIKVVMIDFALCNFRKDYADNVDWSEAKAIQDEEGAVGLIMQDRLECGFV
jgi:hypothetical protein